MKLNMFASAVGLAGVLALSMAGVAKAQVSDNVIKIGVLTDLSGPYSAATGPGAVAAAELAIEDFGGKVNGVPIELISADHQNKPDVGLTIAREWLDRQKVDVLVDITNSAIALALQDLVRDKGRVMLLVGASSSVLTGEKCSPNSVQWMSDTYSSSTTTANALLDQGKKTWFFVQADYTFGDALVADATKVIQARGGKVVGAVRHPFNSSDFSSYLLQAQSSGAEVVAFANSGSDFTQSAKQAKEFGLADSGQTLVGLAATMADIAALGLDAGKGLQVTEAFYWNYNDETRRLAERFEKKTGKKPAQGQAATYSAVRSYLKAIEKAGTDKGDKVLETLRSMEIKDDFTPSGKLREDGRMVHDMYFLRVKEPSQAKSKYDIYDITSVVEGERAARPLADGKCPYIMNKK
ncbi:MULTISPECIES: ABC transporter substrate-binding protein [unclassified Chelatococcus]|uniref:ABC transporter substrate-binding protein n=1 Tax=unclassified Chelatococcus TaxID=2638111 RepID=UPI0020BEE0F8|nr:MULTISPECIES: ABC transporter substrate-binding protein [unclassified Chelatococcus]